MRAGTMVRRFTLGSGPLKRGSDRLQFLLRLALLLSVLAAVPIALAVATATWTDLRVTADRQQATRHGEEATLLRDAPLASATGQTVVPAAVSWTAPDGTRREGWVPVPPGMRSGHAVRVWVDDGGALTRRPMDRGAVTGEAVLTGSVTFLCVLVTAVGAHFLAVRLIDRYRARRWATEWAEVEPQWLRRFH